MKKYKLSEIADIRLGYAFRSAVEPDPNGNCVVIQANNVRSAIEVDHNGSLVRCSLNLGGNPPYAAQGDVFLSSRGFGLGSYSSAVYTGQSEKVLVSASLFIIRLTDVGKQLATPHYISGFFRSPVGQKLLVDRSSGSHVQTLSRTALGEIEIVLPDIERQNSIIDLQECARYKHEGYRRKIRLETEIINSLFTSVI